MMSASSVSYQSCKSNHSACLGILWREGKEQVLRRSTRNCPDSNLAFLQILKMATGPQFNLPQSSRHTNSLQLKSMMSLMGLQSSNCLIKRTVTLRLRFRPGNSVGPPMGTETGLAWPCNFTAWHTCMFRTQRSRHKTLSLFTCA